MRTRSEMAGFARIYRLFIIYASFPSQFSHSHKPSYIQIVNALRPCDATKFVTRAVTFSVELTSFVNHIVRVWSQESRSLESKAKNCFRPVDSRLSDSRLQTVLLLNSHAWTKRSSWTRRTSSDDCCECVGACAHLLRRALRPCLPSLRLLCSYSRFQISTCGR